MKNRIAHLFLVTIAFALIACNSKPDTAQEMGSQMPAQTGGDSISGIATETMDAGGYTYVSIDTGKETVWAAVLQQEIPVGSQVTVSQVMAMPNFRSETLDRSFDLIYFAQAIQTGGSSQRNMSMDKMFSQGKEHTKVQGVDGIDFDDLKAPEGTITIEQAFRDKAELAGKMIAIHGKVVKFTPEVMGKNWLHIQDGTGSEGSNDLTITTKGVFQAGDVVTADGMLNMNVDFGYGYNYELIMEDAEVVKH